MLLLEGPKGSEANPCVLHAARQKPKISTATSDIGTLQVRGNQRVTTRTPEGTYEALSKYGRNLTEEAAKGKLDPVIGRDEEIRRTVQVSPPSARRARQCVAVVQGVSKRVVRVLAVGARHEQRLC